MRATSRLSPNALLTCNTLNNNNTNPYFDMEKDNNKTEIPFIEQVKLFTETMNERFIGDNEDSGKALIVFAMDTKAGEGNDGLIRSVKIIHGTEYDTAYCTMMAMHEKKVLSLLENAAVLSIEADLAISKAIKKDLL